jgi:cytochrome c551/c552
MSYLEIAKKFLEERKAKEGFIKGGAQAILENSTI